VLPAKHVCVNVTLLAAGEGMSDKQTLARRESVTSRG
jgi:hypothetical protein